MGDRKWARESYIPHVPGTPQHQGILAKIARTMNREVIPLGTLEQMARHARVETRGVVGLPPSTASPGVCP